MTAVNFSVFSLGRCPFRLSHPIYAGLLALLYIGTSSAALAADPLDRDVTLSIHSNTELEDALITWGTEAGMTVMIDTSTVSGRLTKADVQGHLSARRALDILLKDSGLSYSQDGARILIVSIASLRHTIASSELHLTDLSDRVSTIADWSGSNPDAEAPTGNGAESGTGEMQEVTVRAHYEFLSADTSGATNLPLSIEKVPQSISLVSNDFVEAANLKTLGEIAEYTPGAINVGNQEGYGSVIQLRGFAAGLAFDGINILGAPYEPDYAIVDRLEIVKGPSSVVYGVSSPGGLVNFVTKSATPETKDYLSVQGGSWHSFRVEGQIAGSLDAGDHVRAIAVAVQDQGDSFLNGVYHKKTTLYGGLNAPFGDSVTGYLHGGYERFERTSFDGNPTEADGTAAPVARSFCICSESIALTTDVYHAETDLTWHATDMLELSLKGNYQTVSTSGILDYSSNLGPDGTILIAANKFTTFDVDNYGVGLSSIYKFDRLGLKDSFVSVGVLYQDSRNSGATLDNYGTANIFAGQSAVSQAFNALLQGPFTPQATLIKASTLTVSAQSVLQVLDPLAVLLGVSYSVPHESVASGGVPEHFDIKGQVSYRAGLTYTFLPGTSAYVSFSQSFNPQTILNVDFAPLPPLKGDQYEAGVKYLSGDGRLLLTGALFQIREKNVAQFVEPSPVGDLFSPIGEITHKGLELQALGRITRQWQINAGYSYLNPKITGAIAGGQFPQNASIGQTQLFLPTQTYSLYTNYTLDEGVLRGLSFGGGLRYVSPQRTSYASALANAQAGLSATRDLPGYTLLDTAVSYSYDRLAVQLNVQNVLNRRYFINNYQTLFYGNLPGDPTNVALTMRWTF